MSWNEKTGNTVNCDKFHCSVKHINLNLSPAIQILAMLSSHVHCKPSKNNWPYFVLNTVPLWIKLQHGMTFEIYLCCFDLLISFRLTLARVYKSPSAGPVRSTCVGVVTTRRESPNPVCSSSYLSLRDQTTDGLFPNDLRFLLFLT